jgi:hypothetical protein
MKTLLLTAVLAGASFVMQAGAQSAASAAKSATTGAPNHQMVNQLPRRAQMYYQSIWGVDSLRVKTMESGELIRFTWRVVDADKAKVLSDKKVQPELIDSQAGVKLVVPAVQNVGMLRQTSTPEVGKSYWVAFSNTGRLVKPGHHVDIVIGQFKAEGLAVE